MLVLMTSEESVCTPQESPPPQTVRELNFENSRLSNYKLHYLDLMYYHLIVGNYCHMTGMNHQTNLQIVKFQTCGL